MISEPRSTVFMDAFELSAFTKKPFNLFTIIKGTLHSYAHQHDFFELLYVKEGFVEHSFNKSKSEIIPKGSYTFIDIGTIHEYTASKDAEILNLIFTPQLIDNSMQQIASVNEIFRYSKFNLGSTIISFPINTILCDSDGAILKIIEFLQLESKNIKPFSFTIIQQSVMSALLHILDSQSESPQKISNITQSLLEIIDKHYAEQNLLTYAASKLSYTITYISAKFKKDFGISFNEYLQIYRINKAKILLNTSNASITEISSSVGYSNVKFFRTLFKQHTNMSPTQYRNIALYDDLQSLKNTSD